MKIIKTKDYQEMSAVAAGFIISQLSKKPSSVFGLATGDTPRGTYRRLISAYQSGRADFSRAAFFNLDEYAGLKSDDKHSYHYYLKKNFFSRINADPGRINLPNGAAESLKAECEEYERRIQKAGGIDLQLLGIGENGHIAFNEPGSSFESVTRVVELSEGTKNANSRFFMNGKGIPGKAITMGIKTIMKAKRIVMLASGRKKAEAVKKMIKGPVAEILPASILRRHGNVVLILDEEAVP